MRHGPSTFSSGIVGLMLSCSVKKLFLIFYQNVQTLPLELCFSLMPCYLVCGPQTINGSISRGLVRCSCSSLTETYSTGSAMWQCSGATHSQYIHEEQPLCAMRAEKQTARLKIVQSATHWGTCWEKCGLARPVGFVQLCSNSREYI